MRPLAVLVALIFGSAAAISFGLITTTIVFLVLKGEQPQLARELVPLLKSCLWFLGLTGVAGGCFYALQKGKPWRGTAQIAMWLFVLAIGYAYWPRR